MEPSELYQQLILDHARRPRHRGACAGATHQARAENPSCGDEIEVHLRLTPEGRIEAATFTGQGCALSQAAASLASEALAGRTVDEALTLAAQVQRLAAGGALTPAEFAALGDLQALRGAARFPQRVRCANLIWQALERALGRGPVPPPALTPPPLAR